MNDAKDYEVYGIIQFRDRDPKHLSAYHQAFLKNASIAISWYICIFLLGLFTFHSLISKKDFSQAEKLEGGIQIPVPKVIERRDKQPGAKTDFFPKSPPEDRVRTSPVRQVS